MTRYPNHARAPLDSSQCVQPFNHPCNECRRNGRHSCRHSGRGGGEGETAGAGRVRTHDATAPDRARTLFEIGLDPTDSAVGKLIEAGVIRGVDSRGRLTVLGDSIDRVAGYYLDEPGYIADRDGKNETTSRKQVLLIVCILLLTVLGVAGLAFILATKR